jgi:magnesium transporter
MSGARHEDPMTPPSGCANAASQRREMTARTRLYRGGRLELEGFPARDIGAYLVERSVTVWLDLCGPGRDDLAVLSAEFGLQPMAVAAALDHRQRFRIDRDRSHLFLTAYSTRLDTGTGELATSEIAAFITSQALITVRQDDGLDIRAVMERWDQTSDLASSGVGYLLYGLLDRIVDSQFEAVQSLDDSMEELEDQLFGNVPRSLLVQRRIFQLRKSLVLLRRIVVPMSEATGELMRHDLHLAGDDLMPYYQDVHDQALRAAERTGGLRDLASSIMETNLTLQGNRLNVITKQVTGWAAIIAVPTLITGFFGMNVPYPGFGNKAGLAASVAIIALTGLVLYLVFKRKDWL